MSSHFDVWLPDKQKNYWTRFPCTFHILYINMTFSFKQSVMGDEKVDNLQQSGMKDIVE